MVKKEVIELLENKKERFFEKHCDLDLNDYPIHVEFWQKERVNDRLKEIIMSNGKDRLAIEELEERDEIGRGITLIYDDCAYVLITNAPYATEKYFTYALYNELAKVYVYRKAKFNRDEIGIDDFEINSMMGYAFWNTFASRMIAYNLCSKEFDDVKRICTKKTFLNDNIKFVDIDIKKRHLGSVLIADLYAICLVQLKFKDKRLNAEKFSFPVDKRWYVGKKLHKEMVGLLKLLIDQLNKDYPYSVDLETLDNIGSKVYDIFWKLKEYEATLAVV